MSAWSDENAPPFDPLIALVRTPPRARVSPALLFVLSFAVFLLLRDRGEKVLHLAVLAGVLLFHEAGHALGMIALGYRDVRIFFIPFFGAATSGKPDGGAGTPHGIVLLLGPLPGIVAGVAIALALGAGRATMAGYVARTLVYINAFNLLPVMPLDGGRLLGLVLFNRHRVLDLGARLLSIAGFTALAIVQRSILLGMFAFMLAMGVRGGWATATAAAALRREGHAMPRRIEEASEALIYAADERLPKDLGSTTSGRAVWLRLVIERAIDASGAPGVAGSIGLLGAWALSVGVSVAAVLVLAKMR